MNLTQGSTSVVFFQMLFALDLLPYFLLHDSSVARVSHDVPESGQLQTVVHVHVHVFFSCFV